MKVKLPWPTKVIIVGNNPILLEKNYGKLIDSYDIVIRINRIIYLGIVLILMDMINRSSCGPNRKYLLSSSAIQNTKVDTME